MGSINGQWGWGPGSGDEMSVYGGGKNCGQSRFGVRVKSKTQLVLLSFQCFLDTQMEVLVRHESNI